MYLGEEVPAEERARARRWVGAHPVQPKSRGGARALGQRLGWGQPGELGVR